MTFSEKLLARFTQWTESIRTDAPKKEPEFSEGALDAFPPRAQGMFPAEDGTSIFYEVRGEGRPLVLCYGLTCRREHWRHQVKAFVEKYQIITFDYRGHHRSSTPADDRHLTLEWCARDVTALLNYLKLEEAVLFGHSMGVPVVAKASGLLSERIRGTVLICGAASNPFEYMFFTNRFSHVYRASAWLFEHAPESYAAFWKQLTNLNPLSHFLTSRFGFNPSVSEERDVLMYLEGVNVTPLTTFHRLLNDYVQCDAKTLLERLRCETLLVAGEDDCITPLDVQRQMLELLPQAELALIPGGSHNAHMDYPLLVNRKIEDFLKRIGYE